MKKILSAASRFMNWVYELFWKRPVTPVPVEPIKLKAQELNLENTCKVIVYDGQRINLTGKQIIAFDKMSRREKREVKAYWAKMERKREIIFQEINGQLVAVRNLNYEKRANIRQ
jgi:hypothetical protein